MTEKQLRYHLQKDELSFSYQGEEYSICPFTPTNIVAGNKSGKQEFSSIDELLTGFIVDGKTLKEILPDIDR